MPRANIYAAIDMERERQERLLVERGWKWSLATPGIGAFQKLMVLVEEICEVAHAIRVTEGFAVAGNSHDNHGLEAELVQVAACAVAWLESLGAVDA